MSVYPTSPSYPSSPTPHPASLPGQPSSITIEQKTEMLPPHLFNVPKEKENPFFTITSKFGSFIGGLFSQSNQLETSVKTLVKECATLFEQGKEAAANTTIDKFYNQCIENNTDPVARNEKNAKFLKNKLTKILLDSGIPPKSQEEIAITVLQDFEAFLAQSKNRVLMDIANGGLKSLKIKPDDHLLSIESLGEETHHYGKAPCLLKFKSGETIVYKPRSMAPESVICAKSNSVFAEAGCGTYEVICAKDERGDYGYCEYLENKKNENQMDEVQDVMNYFSGFAKLEQICKAMGVSDVHLHNVITVKKIPYLIDAESFLNPEFMPTGIFEPNGSAYTFDPLQIDRNKIAGKNKIWFNPSLTQKVDASRFDFQMNKEDLKLIGVDVKNIQQPSPLSPTMKDKINQARTTLSKTPGRFVLLDTETLKGCILRSDHNNPDHLNFFLEEIKSRIKELGFQYIENNDSKITEKFKNNVLHNDVPVFYYDPNNKCVLYEELVIAV